MGKGNLPNVDEPLSNDESKLLRPNPAISLQNSMWLVYTTHFGIPVGRHTTYNGAIMNVEKNLQEMSI